jgi:hypothetical protein
MAIAQRRMLKASEEILRERFLRNRDQTMNVLLAAVKERKLSPHAAAVRWLQQLQIGDDA